MTTDKGPRTMGPGRRRFGREKPRNAKATVKRIISYMKKEKLQLAIVFLAIIASAAAGVVGTYLLKPLINVYIVPFIGAREVDLSGFISMLALMAAVYLAGAASTYLYSRLMINIATGTLYRIRKDLFSHMERLPIRYFDTHVHGELMSHFTNDTDALREMMSQGVPQLISSVVTVTGVFLMMLVLSPLLTLLVVAMLFVMLQVITKIGKRTSTYFMRQQEAIGKVNGYIEEMIEGQKVVKVFSRESKVIEEFDQRNDNLFKAASSANTFANILMPIMGNLSYVLYAITAATGASLAIAGRMDLGTIASFLQYTRNFSHPVTQLSQLFNSVLNALAGAERIFRLIDQESEADSGDVALVNVEYNDADSGLKEDAIAECEDRTGKWAWKMPTAKDEFNLVKLYGDVRFENVTFSYDGVQDVLRNVSFYAKPGQKVALVGSTGAGKTTITNLLNRFYDISKGEIIFDGIPIGRIKKDDLRRSLGMVLQDTHLFTGTVMENIRYGNVAASDEDVIHAAKLANAHTFIKHLPEGYDTVLTSDGSNLSQGQRQLIAIARAAVADPPVLILDEATSSIDTRTEALIEKGMDGLMDCRTVFVIAHRLSTVRNADAILVLENGMIIERGDHEDLLEQKGKYYQLYTGMFELQ
ncbi:MAG TPA: ABC transporter ATP-binding protein [Anaerovoracaceae bacterium]|nr:ABC transporter ATP-binding protein [Anaerovoracaceae bacterium]